MSPRIDCLVGTRPEAIKLAPLVARLQSLEGAVRTRLIATGQHCEIVGRTLAEFGLEPTIWLSPEHGTVGSLNEGLARLLAVIDRHIATDRVDLMVAVGDTTSVLASAMAAHGRGIRFAHLEAGLRSGCRGAPFPEETYRTLVARLAEYHFAPTASAVENLEREGVDPATIHLVGNTVIDALKSVPSSGECERMAPTDRFILATAHRRENWGPALLDLAYGIRDFLETAPEYSVIVPMHPNPTVRHAWESALGEHARVRLVEPIGYREFVAIMKRCEFIITDSGGIQEEAPSLGKRLMVVRETTERPESIASHASQLVLPRRDLVAAAAQRIRAEIATNGVDQSPTRHYGDGRTAERITWILGRALGFATGADAPDLWDWPEEARRRRPITTKPRPKRESSRRLLR